MRRKKRETEFFALHYRSFDLNQKLDGLQEPLHQSGERHLAVHVVYGEHRGGFKQVGKQ